MDNGYKPVRQGSPLILRVSKYRLCCARTCYLLGESTADSMLLHNTVDIYSYDGVIKRNIASDYVDNGYKPVRQGSPLGLRVSKYVVMME